MSLRNSVERGRNLPTIDFNKELLISKVVTVIICMRIIGLMKTKAIKLHIIIKLIYEIIIHDVYSFSTWICSIASFEISTKYI